MLDSEFLNRNQKQDLRWIQDLLQRNKLYQHELRDQNSEEEAPQIQAWNFES